MRGFAFRLPRFFLGLVAVLICQAASAETVEERLDRLSIKFTRDDGGHIVTVELPERSVDATFEAISDIHTITSVKAVNCRATAEGFRLLGKMPALRKLELERSRGDRPARFDEHVPWLKHVPQIESLSVRRSRMTTTGLETLCRSLPHIKELDISHTAVMPHSAIRVVAAELRELEGLTILGLYPYTSEETERFLEFEPVPFGKLASLPKLKRLNASGFPIRGEELHAFRTSSSLKELSLDPFELKGATDALIDLQNSNPALELGPLIAGTLRLSFTAHERRIKSISLAPKTFQKIPPSLLGDVTSAQVTGAPDLAFVKIMPKLKELRLLQPKIFPDEFLNLRDAEHVELLEIQRSHIPAETVEVLLSIPSLKQFGFGSCTFSPEAAEVIRKNYFSGRITIYTSTAREALGLPADAPRASKSADAP